MRIYLVFVSKVLEKDKCRVRVFEKVFNGKLLNEMELLKVWMAEDWKTAEVLLENCREKKADK